MFKIYDGRSEFFQWDLDRKLIVSDPAVDEVHFCNKTDSCSLVCEVYEENGLRLVNVPNILFQTHWEINVFGYCGGRFTKNRAKFKVNARSKPADYVYTETEVKNWEDLEKKVKQVEGQVEGKLDKAIPAAVNKVYICKANTGETIMESVARYTPVPAAIAQYDATSEGWYQDNGTLAEGSVGAVKTGIPQKPSHAVPKQYFEEALAKKLDKPTAPALNSVLGINTDGTTILRKLGANPAYAQNGGVPQYQNYNTSNTVPDVRLITGTPQYDGEAANKKYVDDEVAKYVKTPEAVPQGYQTVIGYAAKGTTPTLWATGAYATEGAAGVIAKYNASGRLMSAEPINDTDVATKGYVDSKAGGGGGTKLYRHNFMFNDEGSECTGYFYATTSDLLIEWNYDENTLYIGEFASGLDLFNFDPKIISVPIFSDGNAAREMGFDMDSGRYCYEGALLNNGYEKSTEV